MQPAVLDDDAAVPEADLGSGVPGLLVQVALFGSAFVGFGLIAELRYGVVERMRVTPMSRTAMLLGRSLRDVVLLLLQAVIMIVLAIPFGLTLDPAGIAVTLGVLALIALVMAPLSYATALVLKSEDAFAPLVQSIVMPLLLLSGILLPMALAPDWLRFLSSINPLTYAVDTAPGALQLRLGQPGDRDRGCGHDGARNRRGLARLAILQQGKRLGRPRGGGPVSRPRPPHALLPCKVPI